MTPAWFLFSSPSVFRARGKDVRRYLHNRLSQDIRGCAPQSAVLAAALTAQGRVEGLFVVFCDEADTFYLACDGGRRNMLLAALSRFIVADRVSLEDVSGEATWCHIACEKSELPPILASENGGHQLFLFSHPRIGEVGSDLLILSQGQENVSQQLEALFGPPLSEAAYNARRFARGVATYPSEINEDMILTECRDRDAVSFTKGCYVGQEVLERGDALGKLPRVLERLVFDRSEERPVVGDTVSTHEGSSLGKVSSLIEEEGSGRVFAFALLRNGKYNYGDLVTCRAATGKVLHPDARVA